MNQIERITHMEQILDEATGIIAAMEEAFQNYQSIQPQLEELFAYYFSPQWKQDLDDDCAGKLPVHLKRGVLSEDAVYNLLTDNMCLIESLQSNSNKYRKTAENGGFSCFLVRDGRLELPTSCSQSRRATNCANPGYLAVRNLENIWSRKPAPYILLGYFVMSRSFCAAHTLVPASAIANTNQKIHITRG